MMHHTYRIIVDDVDGEDMADIIKAIRKAGWEPRTEHQRMWSDND